MFNDDNGLAHAIMAILISIILVCVVADSFQLYRQNKIIQKIEHNQKNIDSQMEFYNMLNNNTIRQKRILYLLEKRDKKKALNLKHIHH